MTLFYKKIKWWTIFVCWSEETSGPDWERTYLFYSIFRTLMKAIYFIRFDGNPMSKPMIKSITHILYTTEIIYIWYLCIPIKYVVHEVKILLSWWRPMSWILMYCCYTSYSKLPEIFYGKCRRSNENECVRMSLELSSLEPARHHSNLYHWLTNKKIGHKFHNLLVGKCPMSLRQS